jgi:probable rRNA maturation factor
MKNLNVSSEKKINVRKILVHKLIGLLKKELNFSISQLQIVFVNADEIHNINKEYLNHDYSTDIITFNYSEEKDKFDGEIYISVEDAAENAQRFDVTVNNEIIRLIIHGILHLLGYDDIDAKDKRVMKKLENSLVEKLKNFDKKKIIIL